MTNLNPEPEDLGPDWAEWNAVTERSMTAARPGPTTVHLRTACQVVFTRRHEPGCSPVTEARVTAMTLPGGLTLPGWLLPLLVGHRTLAAVADYALTALRARGQA